MARDAPHWLDKLGIGRTCQLAGMTKGCITLTVADGVYTLWHRSEPIAHGPFARVMYAQRCSEWLRPLYVKVSATETAAAPRSTA